MDKVGPRHFPDSRPRESEGLAVQRAIAMASYAEAPIYLVHLSCQEAFAPIRAARARGQVIYGETRPLYLHLSKERFDELLKKFPKFKDIIEATSDQREDELKSHNRAIND